MDIRGWPMDQIMQLPDCCFGRKFPILLSIRTEDVAAHYVISEIGLPEVCVLWQLSYNMFGGDTVFAGNMAGTASVKLGDQMPATAAEFLAMEDFFPEADEIWTAERILRAPINIQLKKPYNASGRRIVVRFNALDILRCDFQLGLVFSSIPREVPDCLISEYLRSQ